MPTCDLGQGRDLPESEIVTFFGAGSLLPVASCRRSCGRAAEVFRRVVVSFQSNPQSSIRMGDKSPKSVNKASKQKQAKAATLDQRKKQAITDQKAQGKKK